MKPADKEVRGGRAGCAVVGGCRYSALQASVSGEVGELVGGSRPGMGEEAASRSVRPGRPKPRDEESPILGDLPR